MIALRIAKVSDLPRAALLLEGLAVAREPGGLKRLRRFIERGQVLISRYVVAVFTFWKRTLHVRYFGIHPCQRGRGLGRRVVCLLEAWAHEAGFSRITLAAYRLNRGARAFWQAVGYAVYGHRWFGVLLQKGIA